MSPKEIGFANFAGSDALIRFYKDPEVYKDWVGNKERVINFTQSLKGRRQFCHYDEVIGSLLDYDGLVYGSGNNDLGVMNGGEVTFERQLELYKESRAYLYTGSWPACYTLSFVEAWMTGIPVVAFSKAVTQNVSSLPFYEVDELITDGVDGFIVNTIQEARKAIELLIKDYDRAKTISANARKKAIEIFGREKIMKQWELFLNK
jgi:glycosyltransferase involved in cell wall biosynthesis